MNKVTYFEIPATDLAKAESFYSNVFGWQTKKMGEGYTRLISVGTTDDGVSSTETGAINGGLQQRGERAKAPTVVITTDNIDEVLEKIQANGGTIAVPKDDMGGMGWYAQFEDTEGNRIGVFQAKK